MGTGSHRSRDTGAAVTARAVLAAAFCAVLLSGCESVNDSLKEIGVWPFGSDEATEADAEAGAAAKDPVATEDRDEVALDAALVAKVQTRLADLGYEPGPIDGAMGPKTRGAIRRYQVVVGLTVDGRITESLLTHLEAAQPGGATGRSEASLEPAGETAAARDAAPTVRAARAGRAPALPYEVGSRYVYADGSVETVLEVDGELITWQSSDDVRSVAYGNFLVPRLSWRSRQTSGTRRFDADPSNFWPQTDGEEVALAATVAVQHRAGPDGGSEQQERWRCRQDGGGELTVRAGVFQTRQLVCDGVVEPDGTRLRQIWHYAPAIRHYVLFEEIDGSWQLRRRKELVAIVPSTSAWPPAARAGLGWAIEHALEIAAPGEVTDWTSSAIASRVTVTPGPLAAAGKEGTCRTFLQTWSGPQETRVYPALSCRQASGEWLIPGLDAGVKLAAGAD